MFNNSTTIYTKNSCIELIFFFTIFCSEYETLDADVLKIIDAMNPPDEPVELFVQRVRTLRALEAAFEPMKMGPYNPAPFYQTINHLRRPGRRWNINIGFGVVLDALKRAQELQGRQQTFTERQLAFEKSCRLGTAALKKYTEALERYLKSPKTPEKQPERNK